MLNKQAVTDFILDNVEVAVQSGDEVRPTECLFCGRSRTMRINVKSGWFFCFHKECRAKGRHVRLIQQILGCSWEQAVTKFAQLLDGDARTTESNEEIRDRVTAREERGPRRRARHLSAGLPPDFKPCSAEDPGHWANDYLVTRGVSLESIDRWDIGYADCGQLEGRVIVPIRTAGLESWVARGVYTDMSPKYRTPLHGPDRILFGYDEVENGGLVVAVEGVFDAIRLWSYGIQAVAYLKDGLSLGQVQLLEQLRPRRLVLFPDGGDRAAQARALRDAVKLGSRFSDLSLVLVGGKQKLDPDSGPKDVVLDLIANARPPGRDAMVKFKLGAS